MKRFEDHHQEISDFTDEVLIVCPNCQKMAKVFNPDGVPRLVCTSCGLNKTGKSGGAQTFGKPQDPWFQEELFLQTQCSGEVLFAYNLKHLSLIRNYVESSLRERNREDLSYKNRSIVSRLPGWIKSAKNREEILHEIGLLEKKIYK